LAEDGQRYSNSVMTVSIFNKLAVTVLVNLFASVFTPFLGRLALIACNQVGTTGRHQLGASYGKSRPAL
jgi:hypothetical protein